MLVSPLPLDLHLPLDCPDLNLTKGTELGKTEAKALENFKFIVIQVFTSKFNEEAPKGSCRFKVGKDYILKEIGFLAGENMCWVGKFKGGWDNQSELRVILDYHLSSLGMQPNLLG